MKLKGFFLVLTVFCASTFAQAQDEAITDEELKKYAIVMDSVQSMTDQLLATITEMVNGNENVSAARYNELYKIVDDSAKLAAAEATEVEIAFINEVLAKKDEETKKINATFQSLAKDFLGAKTYNAVKKALKEDAAMKEKYETMLAELKGEEDATGNGGSKP